MVPEPIATYRIQLRPEFGFEKAIEVIDYLSDLGISHLYTSPYLQAAKDSTHGYDVVDPTHINTQLGSKESHKRLCETVKSHGMGMMIDVVPNHMAILEKQNPWWWDVLENGPSSRFAAYFDIDWVSAEERWPNKVLLPMLGDHYGNILESGQFHLSYQEDAFILHYHDHSYPVDPSSLPGILRKAAETSQSETLAFIAESYARLPQASVTSYKAVERRHRDKAVLSTLLARLCQEEPASHQAIQEEIENLNQNIDALDALINQQNYRLAFWRTASNDLGYRRFFDIKDLIGLRIEEMEVFQATHALPIQWFSQGWVQGLRIDHPDGLRNPKEYFVRLQEACPGAWIVIEKILFFYETIPSDWQAISGTTGYDFLNLLNRLFVNSEGKEPLTNAYQILTGEVTPFHDLVYQCKLLAMKELFSSEVHWLTTLFLEICEKNRRYRDYTRFELEKALRCTAASFPVYRSYASDLNGFVSDEDAYYINNAIKIAIDRNPQLDLELFEFLKKLLLLQIKGTLEGEFAMRFQQLTGPAMAKGFEDTALYRFNRLIALNEVGGSPDSFDLSLIQFHEACIDAQKHPLSLLASTTHDTKRSEDVRARLALLSETPQEFNDAMQRWMNINACYKQNDFPDKNTEYLFYQTLIGAWPISLERMLTYMEKATREAKVYTSWTNPNSEYDKSIKDFITATMQNTTFMDDCEKFVTKLIYPGRINSLAQTLIKLTAPGIPDFYQGSELWDLTLVDPDNRGIVDFELRRRLLAEMQSLSVTQVLERMEEGMPKLWIIQKTLQLRKKQPEIFKGIYTPLYADGRSSNHVVAFMRGDALITVTARFGLILNNRWSDTTLELPSGTWLNILSGETLIGGEKIPLQKLLSVFPVALMVAVPLINHRTNENIEKT